MESDYSKETVKSFLDMVGEKGLVNTNTAGGWKAAFTRIFGHIPDSEDVRKIDVKTAVRIYNNAHPGELSPSSLQQYEQRLVVILDEFQKYIESPTTYKGRGRHPKAGNGQKKLETRRVVVEPPTGSSELTGLSPEVRSPTPTAGLSLGYPLRPDFLAQVVIPRDMKLEEARRLTSFILTLAQDFRPPE